MARTLQKKYQRKLNKKVKEVNKNIQKDCLWLGRFEMRQKKASMEYFSDGSGGVLHVIIRIVDKKTNYYKDYILEYAPYYRIWDWHLYEAMNNFITKDAAIWEEIPSPREKEFVIDFRKVPISEETLNKEYNFYLGVEHFNKE